MTYCKKNKYPPAKPGVSLSKNPCFQATKAGILLEIGAKNANSGKEGVGGADEKLDKAEAARRK